MENIPVQLIEGDHSTSEELVDYFALKGIKVDSYASTEEFLLASQSRTQGCLILDTPLAGMAIEKLQNQLIENHVAMPVIFLVNTIAVPDAVRLMKRGAHYLLVKPCDMQLLWEQAQDALMLRAGKRRQEIQQEGLRLHISRLTDRERTILSLALAGKQNKEIARVLSISHRTVEAHRSHILAKTGVGNLLELMGAAIEIEQADHESISLIRTADGLE